MSHHYPCVAFLQKSKKAIQGFKPKVHEHKLELCVTINVVFVDIQLFGIQFKLNLLRQFGKSYNSV